MKARTITTKYITNPLCAYAISFILVGLVFSLKWSYFYQKIDSSLILFLLITSSISLFFAYFIRNKNFFKCIPEDKNNFKFFSFIFLGNIAEYVYCKSIPIITVVLGGVGNYRDFEGIPTFHVLLAGISLFFGVYVFHQYQSNKRNRRLLFYSLFSYIPFILSLNRGGIVLILASNLFIYLMKIRRLQIRHFIGIFISFLIFILLFGIVGNARNNSSQDNNKYILQLGGATEEFIEGNVPGVFYWGYLYIASPIGNLQNVIESSNPQLSIGNFVKVAVHQTTPDFVSKRLFFLVPFNEDIADYLVTPVLNAPTVFFTSYLLMGWVGMIYMFIFMIIVVIIYSMAVKPSSPFFLTGWSYLTTIIFLNIFSNMWFYNGLFLISIPIILTYYKRIKISSQKQCL